MSKVLITGAAGFIGSHLAKHLLEQGDEVVIVDNLCDYYDPEYKKARLEKFLQPRPFLFFPADISDMRELEKIFAAHRFERIYHLAAQAGVRYSLTHPEIYGQTNMIGTLNLLTLATKHKVSHFVFASSSSVYGAAKTFPLTEDAAAIKPLSLYAATKLAGEAMLYAACKTSNLKGTAFRFFNAYGPWARPDAALFIFTRKILSGEPVEVYDFGRAERDFTFVTDIVRGIALAARQKAQYDVYNLGNSHPILLLNYLDILDKNLGQKSQRVLLPARPEDIPKSHADISKAKSELGFMPQTSVEQGIAEFVAWYKKYEIPLRLNQITSRT